MNAARLRRRCPWQMASVASITLALALPSRTAWAQAAPVDDATLARQLEQSLKLIGSLSARVEALKKQLAQSQQSPATTTADPAAAAASAVTPSREATAARVDELERTVNQLTSSQGREMHDAGLPLHEFADVGWSQVHAAPGEHSGFAVGSLDFYLTSELGEIKTLVELNVGVSEDGETLIDLERAQLGYAFNDLLTLWLGRFHTPFGYWNMAFHHGRKFRPRSFDRHRFHDDGWWPSHCFAWQAAPWRATCSSSSMAFRE